MPIVVSRKTKAVIKCDYTPDQIQKLTEAASRVYESRVAAYAAAHPEIFKKEENK